MAALLQSIKDKAYKQKNILKNETPGLQKAGSFIKNEVIITGYHVWPVHVLLTQIRP